MIERDRENERDNVGPLNQCCCSQGLYVLREKEDRERGEEGERKIEGGRETEGDKEDREREKEIGGLQCRGERG